MLGNFSCFCCRLLTFFKINFSKKSSWNTNSVSNCSEPDQDRHSAGPGLGPKLFAKAISRRQNVPLARKVLPKLLELEPNSNWLQCNNAKTSNDICNPNLTEAFLQKINKHSTCNMMHLAKVLLSLKVLINNLGLVFKIFF